MTLAQAVATGALLPLQFGGDLIGLAILFLVLAVIAAILGASGVAGISMQIAKWLVIIFVVLAVVSFVLQARAAQNGGGTQPVVGAGDRSDPNVRLFRGQLRGRAGRLACGPR